MTDVISLPTSDESAFFVTGELFNSIVNSSSTPKDLRLIDKFNTIITWAWQATAAPQDMLQGESQIDTLTFPALAGAGEGDYLVINDINSNSWAAALGTVADVTSQRTLNFADLAGTGAGDLVIMRDIDDTDWGFALKTVADVAAQRTLNFADLAGTLDGDFILMYDMDGTKWGFALDVDGGGVPNVGPIWTGIPAGNKAVVDISAIPLDENIAAAVKSALEALTGFSSKFTITDNLDGTLLFVLSAPGLPTAWESREAAEVGGGSTTVTSTVAGSSATPVPTGPKWSAIPAGNKVFVDISAIPLDENIAAAVVAALNGLSGFNSKISLTDNADGTVLCELIGPGPIPTAWETLLADESGAGSVAIALTRDGTNATVAPTGAVWTAIPAGRKVLVDVSALPAAADIAAAVEAALNALTGFTALITTDDTAADGTMILTHVDRGPVAVPGSLTANDSGPGSITNVATNTGVVSAIDVTANSFTKTSHGLFTGQEVKFTVSAGAIPSPLVIGTSYYVIKISDNVFKVATTRANAVAGSPIDITDQGTDGSTLTATTQANAGTLTIEHCIDADVPTISSTWYTLASTNLVTATSPVTSLVAASPYLWLRATLNVTSGALSSCISYIHGK